MCAGYTFPYLFDESQAVAKAYKAACTPEFYVFDANQQLTYHGQFDDARPNSNKLVTGGDRTGDLCALRMVSWVGFNQHIFTALKKNGFTHVTHAARLQLIPAEEGHTECA